MPRPKEIDTERVVAMLDLGCPVRIIAERLGCSARHVRRIRRERDVEHKPHTTWSSFWGSDYERFMIWGGLADLGFSSSRIAYHVGRTRQAVSQWRRTEYDAEDDPADVSADPANWNRHGVP